MNNFFNVVSARYLSSFIVEASTKENKDLVTLYELSMFNIDLAQYGFTAGKTLLNELKKLSKEEMNDFSKMVHSILSKEIRTDIVSVPLFKRFPYETQIDQDVYFENRVVEYFRNQFASLYGKKENRENFEFLSCGHMINKSVFDLNEFGACPICQCKVAELEEPAQDLPPLINLTPLKVLELASNADVYHLFKNMVNSKVAYSEDFKEIILSMFELKGSNIKGLLPREIENKENASFITSCLFNVEGKKAIKYAKSYIKTATDVLRLAVAFSNGDVSLAENTKYKLTSSQRTFIMSLLDNVKSGLEEDLLRYRESWLRLSKTLHIGANRDKYKTAFKAIDKLRNNPNQIETFDSNFERLLEMLKKNKSKETVVEIVELLKQRPGVFARKLDLLLRENNSSSKLILDTFESVIDSVSTNVLLSVYKFIQNRNDLKKKVYIPKGNVVTLKIADAPTGKLKDSVVTRLASMTLKEIKARFAEREKFENVYIDPAIEKIIVPFAMRANSKGSLNMSRGSRMPISSETDVVNFFINWFDNGSRVDLDLSACFLDEDFNVTGQVSYFDYDPSKNGLAHYSGDVQSGGGKHGGYEGISINLNNPIFKDSSKRYVAMSVISFNGSPFNTFEAVAGYQERESLNGGNAYEASKVKTKFEVSGASRSAIPLIVDLKTREIIWVDAQNKSNSSMLYLNVRSEEASVRDIVEAFVNFDKYKLTMKELVSLHSYRFGHVDYEKDPEKEYDLELDMDFALNLPEVVSKWL